MIEGGKSIPPLSMIEKIADVLGIRAHLLLVSHQEIEAFDRERFLAEASQKISGSAREILAQMLETEM